jgi:hypothetical protein
MQDGLVVTVGGVVDTFGPCDEDTSDGVVVTSGPCDDISDPNDGRTGRVK